jgi:hypothetical protein
VPQGNRISLLPCQEVVRTLVAAVLRGFEEFPDALFVPDAQVSHFPLDV